VKMFFCRCHPKSDEGATCPARQTSLLRLGTTEAWALQVFHLLLLAYLVREGAGGDSGQFHHVGSGAVHILKQGGDGNAPSGLIGILEGHTAAVYTLTISPEGCLVTGATDRSIAIWNVSWERFLGKDPLTTKHKPIRRLQGHDAGVTALAFVKKNVNDGMPSGLLASGGADNATKIWDVQAATALLSLPHPKTVFGIATHPEGGEIGTASWDGVIRFFTLPTGMKRGELSGHDAGLYSVAYSPLDSSLLASASADRTVRIWDVKQMQLLWTLKSHRDHVTTVEWSPLDPFTLASGGWDRKFRLWHISQDEVSNCRSVGRCAGNLQPRLSAKHPQLVWRVAFAPHGETVAACHGAVGQSPTVVIYDVRTGHVSRRLGRHKDTPLAIAWSPDGSMLASAGMDGKVLLYEATGIDDMPRGDLDDAEELAKWAEDLATYQNERRGGATKPNNSSNVTNNEDNGSAVSNTLPPHPLANRRIAFY